MSASAKCVAVIAPNGEITKIFVQFDAPSPNQCDDLLSWAWHEDKPRDDDTPCTHPKDTHIARAKGYRVTTGTFTEDAP